MNKLFFVLSAFFLTVCFAEAKEASRLKIKFDFDWKFTLSDQQDFSRPEYDDAGWQDVQLPHDWNIKQRFDRKESGAAAYLPEGTGWYRKTFRLPRGSAGKSISVAFGGIFHQSDVYINGRHLGFRPYGFCGLEYDLTPYLNLDGENVIAVRANTRGERPRWYTGAGIYRHAWLYVKDPVHVINNGTYITTPVVSSARAGIKARVFLANNLKYIREVRLRQRILDASGRPAAPYQEKQVKINPGDTVELCQEFTVDRPLLWSVASPHLYTMETKILYAGREADLYSTTFGIRSFRFDKDRGFFVNDQPLKLKGLCLHEDAGSLGVAVPDRANERRLEILREYGCNAIRCAHNPPSEEFLDMCDRMGFIVIDEALDKWKSGYYEKYFDSWWKRDIGDMILRDRNHPSIALWSIGNELTEAWLETDEGVNRAKMLNDFVHQLEPSRPTTLAVQNNHQEKFADVTDVIGYNYLEARMLSDKKKYPQRVCLVSEELPYYRGLEGRIRSYTPLNAWKIVEENDFVSGGFIWSGVDYLGEAGWPGKGWPNGLFDVCMFEKPRAAYHRARWNPEPMVRIAVADQSMDIDHGRDLWQWPKIAAHWNFPDKYIGLIMQVHTTSNCESVELYLNGKLMGRENTSDYTNNTIIWNIPYNPGVLEARAYNGDKKVAEYKIATSKCASFAELKADRSAIKADGQDLSFIALSLKDEDGRPVQTDDRLISVSVHGGGHLAGLDNGDLRRASAFSGDSVKTHFGKALIIIQSQRRAGEVRVRVQVEGIDKPLFTSIKTR